MSAGRYTRVQVHQPQFVGPSSWCRCAQNRTSVALVWRRTARRLTSQLSRSSQPKHEHREKQQQERNLAVFSLTRASSSHFSTSSTVRSEVAKVFVRLRNFVRNRPTTREHALLSSPGGKVHRSSARSTWTVTRQDDRTCTNSWSTTGSELPHATFVCVSACSACSARSEAVRASRSALAL